MCSSVINFLAGDISTTKQKNIAPEIYDFCFVLRTKITLANQKAIKKYFKIKQNPPKKNLNERKSFLELFFGIVE